MSSNKKIRIEMTPTDENTFRKAFIKSQENFREALKFDLMDMKNRNYLKNELYTSFYGFLQPGPGPFFTPKPRQRLLVVGGGASYGKVAMLDLIKKLRQAKDLVNNTIPLSPFVLDSTTLPQIKGSDFVGALSGMKDAQRAFAKLSKTGFTAKEATRGLLHFKDLGKPTISIKDNYGGSYGKQQAIHWSNKYSHKIRRNL